MSIEIKKLHMGWLKRHTQGLLANPIPFDKIPKGYTVLFIEADGRAFTETDEKAYTGLAVKLWHDFDSIHLIADEDLDEGGDDLEGEEE